MHVNLDVTDAASVDQALRSVERELDVVDLLVNNAGVAGSTESRSWEDEPSDWWRVFEVNVLGSFLCSRAVLPSMVERRAGRIVNIASNAAFYRIDVEDVIDTAYMASKSALVRLGEALAAETAAYGISVFTVSPGMVKTDMTAAIFPELWDDPQVWAEPELAAELVEFIASGALDGLSGRYIHAVRDNWREMPENVTEILNRDWHSVRLQRAEPL